MSQFLSDGLLPTSFVIITRHPRNPTAGAKASGSITGCCFNCLVVGDPSELNSRSVFYVRIEVSVRFRRWIAFWRNTAVLHWPDFFRLATFFSS